MSDLGGGWGGSQIDIYDASGNNVSTNTFTSALNSWDTLCLPDGCYNVVVTSGTNDGGVAWSLLMLQELLLQVELLMLILYVSQLLVDVWM
jgi:hypothetical protein